MARDKRGLRHIAPLACAREIQLLGHREEITNLMHFHDNLSGRLDIAEKGASDAPH